MAALQFQGEPALSPEGETPEAADAASGEDSYQHQPDAWNSGEEAYDAAASDPEGVYDEPFTNASGGPDEGTLAGGPYSPTALEQDEAYPESAADPEGAYAASVEDGGDGGPYGSDESAFESETPQFAADGASPEDLAEAAAGTAAYPPRWRSAAEEEEDLLSRLASDSAAAKPGQPQPKKALPKAARASALAALKQKCAAAITAVRQRLAGKDFKAIGRTWPMKPTLLGIAAAVALLGILGTVLIWRSTRTAPAEAPAGTGLAVTIQSSPPGATLTVDGKACVSPCQLELAAASHRVEANLAGFRAAAVSFDLNDNNAGQPVVVTLLPLSPVLQVNSDLASGEVTLDGNRIGELEDGGFDQELGELGPGEHTLPPGGPGKLCSVTFEIPAGGAPKFTAPPNVNSLKGVIIAGLGAVAQVYGSDSGEAVGLDGQPVGKLGSDALVLTT